MYCLNSTTGQQSREDCISRSPIDSVMTDLTTPRVHDQSQMGAKTAGRPRLNQRAAIRSAVTHRTKLTAYHSNLGDLLVASELENRVAVASLSRDGRRFNADAAKPSLWREVTVKRFQSSLPEMKGVGQDIRSSTDLCVRVRCSRCSIRALETAAVSRLRCRCLGLSV